MSFIANSKNNIAVQRDDVKVMLIQGLWIILKMRGGPDIVYEEASDEAELATLKTRTWNQLTAE